MRIPSRLLAKVYVKGSLCNGKEGFVFAIKNILARGTATAFLGLVVDGAEYPLDKVSVVLNGSDRIEATEISSRAPLSLDLGRQVSVIVGGRRLAPGPHEIVIRFRTKEVGEVRLPIRDCIEG